MRTFCAAKGSPLSALVTFMERGPKKRDYMYTSSGFTLLPAETNSIVK